jgi:hypothetical protein
MAIFYIRGAQPAAQKYFCAAQTGFRIQRKIGILTDFP